MLDFFKSLFRPPAASGETAKERLRLVLLSDHLSLAPDVVESLKRDLMEVISRYVEIDSAHADVTFEHREREIAMLANIPITGVRERRAPLAPPPVVPTPARFEGRRTPPFDTLAEPISPAAPEPVAAAQIAPELPLDTLDEPDLADFESAAPEEPAAVAPSSVAFSENEPELAAENVKRKREAKADEGAAPVAVRTSNAAAPRRRRRKRAAAAAAAAAGKRTAQQQLGNQASAQA